MSVPVAEIVDDLGSLLEAVGVAVAFGLGVMLVFSFAAFGSGRAYEARLQGRFALARAWGAVAALGLAGVAAGITLGLIVMTQR